MTKCQSVLLAVLMLGIYSTAQAETLYVAERMLVGLRAEALDTSPVVKTVETGKPLEVLQRQDRFVQVRDPQGAEGWIEARYLTPDPPARVQLAQLQDDLKKSQAQTAEAKAQLKKAQTTAAEQAAKITELSQGLARAAAEKTATPPAANPVAPPPAATAPPVGKGPEPGAFAFSYLWLGISFAMLGIGFGAGVKWLRESIRKRSGGMYLRV